MWKTNTQYLTQWKQCDGWLGTRVPTRSHGDYLRMFDDARWLGLDYLQMGNVGFVT